MEDTCAGSELLRGGLHAKRRCIRGEGDATHEEKNGKGQHALEVAVVGAGHRGKEDAAKGHLYMDEVARAVERSRSTV